MPTAHTRATIVAAAREWLGTPYHHMADIKGVGVDCAMILVRVYCDLGLVAHFDPRPYSRDWFLHRDEERYLGFLLDRAHEVALPLPGDVVLFKLGRCFGHGGIVTLSDPLTILHAYAPARTVVEERIATNPALAERLSAAKFASYFASETRRAPAAPTRANAREPASALSSPTGFA